MLRAGFSFLLLCVQEPGDLRDLIRALGAESEQVREAATRRLIEAPPGAEPALRRALESADDAEVRERLERILAERRTGGLRAKLAKILPPSIAQRHPRVPSIIAEANDERELALLLASLGIDPTLPGAEESAEEPPPAAEPAYDWNSEEIVAILRGLALSLDDRWPHFRARVLLFWSEHVTEADLQEPEWWELARGCLKDSNFSLRLAGIRALAKSAAEREALAPLLKDEQPEVRAAAADALAEKKYSPAVAELLRDPHDPVRAAAARSLFRANAREYVVDFVPLLNPKGTESAREAYQALRQWPAEDAVAPLARLLESEQADHVSVLAILGAWGFPACAESVSRFLEAQKTGDLAAKAFDTLVKLGAKEHLVAGVPLLLEGAHREWVKEIFASLRPPGVARRILAILETDGAPPDLLELLVQLRDPDLCEPAGRLLTHSNPGLRLASVRILSEIGRPESLAGLVPCLKDSEASVRETATRALVEHAAALPPEALAAVAGFLREPAARPESLRVLSASGSKAHAESIAECLSDPSPDVRAAAAIALRSLDARELASRLLPLLTDPEPGPREAARAALVAWRPPEFTAALVNMLKDRKEAVREQALRLLAEAGERPPEAARCFRDEAWTVRAAAAETLRDPAYEEDLAALLGDPRAAVRLAAVETLARLRLGGRLIAALQGVDAETRAAFLLRFNAARHPDLFDRLKARTPSGVTLLTLQPPLEAPEDLIRDETRILPSALALLEAHQIINGFAYTFLIEEKTIRAVSVEEAEKFWRNTLTR